MKKNVVTRIIALFPGLEMEKELFFNSKECTIEKERVLNVKLPFSILFPDKDYIDEAKEFKTPKELIEFVKKEEDNYDYIFIYNIMDDNLNRLKELTHYLFLLILYPDKELKHRYTEFIKKGFYNPEFSNYFNFVLGWDKLIDSIKTPKQRFIRHICRYRLKRNETFKDFFLKDDDNKYYGTFKWVFQNNNMHNNVPETIVSECDLCHSTINNWENYYSNNNVDVCCICANDLDMVMNPNKKEKSYDVVKED